jgi:hypothetical protein
MEEDHVEDVKHKSQEHDSDHFKSVEHSLEQQQDEVERDSGHGHSSDPYLIDE